MYRLSNFQNVLKLCCSRVFTSFLSLPQNWSCWISVSYWNFFSIFRKSLLLNIIYRLLKFRSAPNCRCSRVSMSSLSLPPNWSCWILVSYWYYFSIFFNSPLLNIMYGLPNFRNALILHCPRVSTSFPSLPQNWSCWISVSYWYFISRFRNLLLLNVMYGLPNFWKVPKLRCFRVSTSSPSLPQNWSWWISVNYWYFVSTFKYNVNS